MTDQAKQVEALAAELAKAIGEVFNTQWRAWNRSGAVVETATALDMMAARFDYIASGCGVLADRCRDLAGEILAPED
jgi:hypothetical protein